MIIIFHFTLSVIPQPWRTKWTIKIVQPAHCHDFRKTKISNNDKAINYPLAWRFSSNYTYVLQAVWVEEIHANILFLYPPRPSETIDSL